MVRPEQVRGSTHGDYGRMSITAQALKAIMRQTPNWERMTTTQQEALELIATKISRITCGDPNHHDHWADIGGYAELALNRIPHAKARIEGG